MPRPCPPHDDDDHEERQKEHSPLEEVSHALGIASLLGLIVLNALYYYSMGLKRIPQAARARLPEKFKRPLKWKSRFRKYHYWGNPVVLGIGYLHGVWAEEENFILWAGWGLIVVLAISGLIMKLQKADEPGAKASRLIHSQHFFSVLMVVLLLIGHAVAD